MEDDDRVTSAVRSVLNRHGIESDRVSRAADVLAFVADADAVLLDLGLPDADGMDVCRQIRQVCDVPILIATGRGEVADRVLGLNAGADDYLVKPYHVGELVARLHALVRRAAHRSRPDPTTNPVVVAAAGVVVDMSRHEVTVDGREVRLSPNEFRVLELIAECRGSVCTRDRLIAGVWGRSWPGAARSIDVHIAGIRSKTGRPEAICTVRGVGYRMAVTTAEMPP